MVINPCGWKFNRGVWGMEVNISTHMYPCSALRPFTLTGKHITSQFFVKTLVLGAEGCPQRQAEPGPSESFVTLIALLRQGCVCKRDAGSMMVASLP